MSTHKVQPAMIGYLIDTWDLLVVLPMDGNIAIWLISTLVTMVQKILPQATSLASFLHTQ